MKTIAATIFLVLSLAAVGQNTIGLPEIINYSKQAYGAGSQNWDIKQDHGGLVYFGNNEGLLTFDGTFWKLYSLPNHTIVRSVEIARDQRIYVGGQNELGYFSPNERGVLLFHSLLSLIPAADRSFDDVWNICEFGNELFFRTNKRIFRLSSGRITVYPTRSEWRFIGCSNHTLLAEDLENGVFVFQNGAWQPMFQNSELSPRSLLTSFVPLDDQRSLVTTLKDGVFTYDGSSLTRLQSRTIDHLAKNMIYKAAVVEKNRIALATSFDGCHIINESGQLVQSLTHQEGLQNNNIRSIFSDRDKNLWLGLDNGVDFVAFSNSVKHIYPESQNIGSGYSSLIYGNELYFGTSNGLYKVPIEKAPNLSFVKQSLGQVSNTEGEVWNLSVVNDQLLIGHHNGAYLVRNNAAVMLDNTSGFWTFQPMSNILPTPLMVAGNYLGLQFFRYANGNFLKTPLGAQFESARFVVVEDERTVWVAHPYKGIYRISVLPNNTTSVKLYDRHGFPSPNNNYLFKIKNRIVAATENGIYEYVADNDVFEPSAFFHDILNEKKIRYLKEDPAGNIWFVREKELGVVDFSQGKPRTIYFPELNNKLVSGFENVFPFDEHNILIGGEKGFYHVDFENYKRNRTALETRLRVVRSTGKADSVLYGGYTARESTSLPFSMNSLHFEYSAILYGQQSNIEYSYRLSGFDRDWSAWSGRPEKEYTNLPAGKYVFQVKARNNLGNESPVCEYRFSILPPWYRTTVANLFYLVVLIGLVVFWQRRQHKKFLQQRQRFEEKQKQMEYLHQLELEKNEKEIVKLKNEKLESEIGHKNSELATSAMHLVQKREMLGKIRDDLNGLIRRIDNEQLATEFKRLLRVLAEDNKTDDHWEHFAHHFDNVHTDFLTSLKARYPILTPSELRLCAYLRMNLSNKEIAQLVNISTRGVEIARYRLRKKLGLAKETNLFEFLMAEQGAPVKTNGQADAQLQTS